MHIGSMKILSSARLDMLALQLKDILAKKNSIQSASLLSRLG